MALSARFSPSADRTAEYRFRRIRIMSAAIAGAEPGRVRNARRGFGALQRAERMLNYFPPGGIARNNDTDPAAVSGEFQVRLPKLRR